MVEDHLSALCETMRLLVAGDSVLRPQSVGAQRAFFERQIAPWYADCCDAIMQSPIANYYAAVAQFAMGFLALERDSIVMHCSDAPCAAVCPVDCFVRTEDGVVLHDKDLCIGCGYCFYACPFGAPQFPQEIGRAHV